MLNALLPAFRRARASAARLCVFSAVLSLASISASVSNARADTLTWTGAGDGKTFSMSTNWSPAVVPNATSDCVIPAGATAVNIGNASIRSLSLSRNMLVQGCGTVTVKAGISLAAGAVITVDNTGGCTAFVFDGGTQAISGNGQILITSEGNNGAFLRLDGNASVTIQSGISITYAATFGSGTTAIISQGCSLVNEGTWIMASAGKTLSIAGPGSFENRGTIRCDTGTLAIQPSSWFNQGQIVCTGGSLTFSGNWSNAGSVSLTAATWTLGGNFSSLGMFVQIDSRLNVDGTFTGTSLEATPQTGDIHLVAVKLKSTLLRSTGGTRFIASGISTIESSSLDGILVFEAGHATRIKNGLVLLNQASVSLTGLLILDGPQSVSGSGVFLYGNGGLAIRGSSVVSIQSGVRIDTDPDVVNAQGTIELEGTSTLDFAGDALVSRSGATLSVSGNGTLQNRGTWRVLLGARLNVLPYAWSNQGLWNVDGGELSLYGRFSSLGAIERNGGSLKLGGVFLGSTLSAPSTAGAIQLDSLSLTNVAVDSPAGGFQIVGETSWTGCSFKGALATTCCSDFTIRNGLTLLGGATVTVRSNMNFRGGVQTLAGSGTIALDEHGSFSVIAGADLTVAPGITVLYDQGAAGTVNVSIDQSSKLTSQGTIRCLRAGGNLSIGGQGTFVNSGLLEAVAGRISLWIGSWNSTGIVRMFDGDLTIEAAISSLGAVERFGTGRFRIAGSFTGPTLVADAGTGDIAFSDITFSNQRLEARDGAKFIILPSLRSTGTTTTLNNCTIAAPLEIVSCSPVIVTGGLHLESAFITLGRDSAYNCAGGLSFQGDQAIDGSGQIVVRDGLLKVWTPLTIGPQIEVRADQTASYSSMSIYDGATVFNQGRLVGAKPSGHWSVSGGKIINAGTIEAQSSALEIHSALTNTTGSCKLAAGATLELNNLQNCSSRLERQGGTLRLGGVCTDTEIDMDQPGSTTILSSLKLTGARLSSVAGSAFKIAGATTLDTCTLAGDMSVTTSQYVGSAVFTFTNGLTFENNARFVLNAPSTNDHFVTVRFDGSPAGLFGQGELRWELGTVSFLAPGTIAPGITLRVPPTAEGSAGLISAATLHNQGTIIFEMPGGMLRVSGTLNNQGSIQLLAGSATLTMKDFAGAIALGPGTAATLSGTYAIDKPIAVLAGSTLTLNGNWANSSTITVNDATLATGGTWTNSGTISLVNSTWKLGGSYSSLGAFDRTNSSVVWGGNFTGPVFTAGPETGDVLLNGMSFTGTKLQTAGGYRFIIGSGATLTNCRLATNFNVGPCATLNIRQTLTLENGAVIDVENTGDCTSTGITFGATSPPSSSTSVGGVGEIVIRTKRSGTIAQSMGSATFGIDVVLRYEPSAPGAAGLFQISSPFGVMNMGVIRSTAPGSSLTFSGGSFRSLGTVESIAGSLMINPSSLTNYTTATGRLSGGRWRAIGGQLSIGARPIREIAAGTELSFASPAGIPDLSTLAANAGTLSLSAGALTITPASGTFGNTGIIDLGPGALINVTGSTELGGTFRTAVSGFEQSECGSLFAAGIINITGRLTGAFKAPFTPIQDDPFGHILAAPTITGGFSSACFDASSSLLGVVPVLNTDDAPDVLDLVASGAQGMIPLITAQPPASVRASPDATMFVTAAPADAACQWRLNGLPLVDGPTPHGSVIAGAQSRTLTITGAKPQDAGSYTAALTSVCGSAISSASVLTVCPGDLNSDTLVDDADFVLFLASYHILDCADPAMPALCPGDFNSDSVVDDADFTLFIPAYEALLCP